MNPQQTPSTNAGENSIAGEAAAVAYLAQELPKARKTFKRTRIVGLVLICFVGAYMGVISSIMVNFFQPKEAAEVASGMLAQHAMKDGPVLAAQIERGIPSFIRQVPDYLIKEIPVYRKELQQTLETEYRTYCASFSKDLGDQIDKLIDDHQAEIKTLLENANDREAIRKVLPNFDQVISDFTKHDVDGRALKKHIDDLAAALKEVENRMNRLANGNDLTSDEQKARRALAMLAKVIEDSTTIPPERAPIPVKKPLP
jgi:hypothetical protein